MNHKKVIMIKTPKFQFLLKLSSLINYIKLLQQTNGYNSNQKQEWECVTVAKLSKRDLILKCILQGWQHAKQIISDDKTNEH